jgi:hypothetical protein
MKEFRPSVPLPPPQEEHEPICSDLLKKTQSRSNTVAGEGAEQVGHAGDAGWLREATTGGGGALEEEAAAFEVGGILGDRVLRMCQIFF